MGDDEIAVALFARAELLAEATGLPVAFPEVSFQPPAEGGYLRVRFFPNAPAWQGLASGRVDQGILQVTVVWPRNEGVVRPLAVAGQVKAHFPKDLSLSGVIVTAEPFASALIPDEAEALVPVSILWKAA